MVTNTCMQVMYQIHVPNHYGNHTLILSGAPNFNIIFGKYLLHVFLGFCLALIIRQLLFSFITQRRQELIKGTMHENNKNNNTKEFLNLKLVIILWITSLLYGLIFYFICNILFYYYCWFIDLI